MAGHEGEFRDDSVYGSEQSEGGKSDDEVKGSKAYNVIVARSSLAAE